VGGVQASVTSAAETTLAVNDDGGISLPAVASAYVPEAVAEK
jgi:hypothetical protein